MRVVVPLMMSRTNTSMAPLPSTGTRLLARDWKLMIELSAEGTGFRLVPLASTPKGPRLMR